MRECTWTFVVGGVFIIASDINSRPRANNCSSMDWNIVEKIVDRDSDGGKNDCVCRFRRYRSIHLSEVCPKLILSLLRHISPCHCWF